MMMSSNENIFRIPGPLCGDSTMTGEFPTQRPVFSLICTWTNGWINTWDAVIWDTIALILTSL